MPVSPRACPSRRRLPLFCEEGDKAAGLGGQSQPAASLPHEERVLLWLRGLREVGLRSGVWQRGPTSPDPLSQGLSDDMMSLPQQTLVFLKTLQIDRSLRSEPSKSEM